MPAYRSSAEAEVREAVVERLRLIRPSARIIHEINASDFGNRIDVLAVSESEIVAVEIKSEKDKLDRLPKQIVAMRGVAHHIVAALHEKFLVEQRSNKWSAYNERDGEFYVGRRPNEARGARVWVYPERRRCIHPDSPDFMAQWHSPEVMMEQPLPANAIHMLWRDELCQLCSTLRVSVPRRAPMKEMVRALRWYCSGRELTRGICTTLRRRECIEADEPIEEALPT